MRWPRSKKPSVDPDTEEAKTAAKDAQIRLVATRAQWPEVRAITDRLAFYRERNHLAEALREAIGGDQQ